MEQPCRQKLDFLWMSSANCLGIDFPFLKITLLSFPMSSIFSNTNNYGGSGVIYSTGWPSRYIRSYFSCNHKIQRANGYQGVLVVFMDINMYNSYYYGSDCVQLFGKFLLY